jgi:hypothetical protein
MLEKLYNLLKGFLGIFRLNTETTNNVPNFEALVLEQQHIPELTITALPFQIDMHFLQHVINVNLVPAALVQIEEPRHNLAFAQLNSLGNTLELIARQPRSHQPPPLPPQIFVNPSKENTERLDILPLELWLRIFNKLPIPDLLKTITVCKYFGELTNEPTLRMAMALEKQRLTSRMQFFDNRQSVPSIKDFFIVKTEPVEDIYSEPGEQGFIWKGKR